MTTREKAQKLLDETPEDKLEPFVEILASRGTSGSKPEAAEPGDIIDDWGNLSAMTRSAAGDLMDRLAEEEAAAGLDPW